MIVLSFPHNPTTACVDVEFFQQVVDFAREKDVVVVHDNAYAELGFDGYEPPSILQAEGAKECAVELYSMTKSFSMAGWRVAFLVGNAEVVAALTKLKSYLDYGTFQPIQIAATVTLNEDPDHPREVQPIYQARRDALCDGLNRIGWEIDAAEGDDVRLGADPRALPRAGLDRVRVDAGPRGAGGHVAGRRLRSRRRRPRALRADRERAAHQPGHPQPPAGAHEAGLSDRALDGGAATALGSMASAPGRGVGHDLLRAPRVVDVDEQATAVDDQAHGDAPASTDHVGAQGLAPQPAAPKARTTPSALAAYTTPPATAGCAATATPAVERHSTDPVSASTATTEPLAPPKYSVSPSRAGWLSVPAASGVDHLVAPVAGSSAYAVPFGVDV